MGTLGREKLWTSDIWATIDKAVTAEVGRQRVAQKVFDAVPMPNAPNVPALVLLPPVRGSDGASAVATLRAEEGTTRQFMEISLEFPLTEGQVESESTFRTAQIFARLAARSIALAEDALFFQGGSAPLPPGVRVTNAASAGAGLLNLAGALAISVEPQDGGGFGERTFRAVSQAIAQLTANGHPGPFALCLEPTVFADTYAPAAGTLVTTADRILPLVEGRMYSTAALPPGRGIFFSLGGEPTTIYIAQEAMAGYTQVDQQGVHQLRVSERVQIVPIEETAFIRLEFQISQ